MIAAHSFWPMLSLLPAVAAIGLIGLLGARMLGGTRFGLVTTVLFASTPVIWRSIIHSPAALRPLPFVLGWLLAIDHAGRSRAAWPVLMAGVVLGLGVHTSNAAAVMMPLYLLLTLAVLSLAEGVSPARLGVCIAAFAAAVAPIVLPLVRHPEKFRSLVKMHRLYDADRFNLLQGVHEMVSWIGLTARSEMYYDYFNPAFLFLTGRVLLWPLVVLLPLGIYRLAIDDTTPLARLCLAGFFTAPFAASLTAERPIPERSLFITVFAALISAYAVRYLLSLRRRSR